MTPAERILSESPVWLPEALAAVLPGGTVPSANTLTRWVQVGVQTPAGSRVKLEAVRIGGRLATSPAAVRRFIAAQQQPADEVSAVAPVRSPAGRRKGADAAGRRLELMGC